MWLSRDGFQTWCSQETKTGTVNCYFTAPVGGRYRCTASLQSYPTNELAVVDCSIDGSSFGSLPVVGTRHQPHYSDPQAGPHEFTIRQQQGSFYFLALRVDRFWIPEVTEG